MRLSKVAAGVALLVIPTIASAHGGNNDPNMVHACIGNVSKVARIVGVGGSCISAPPLVAETPAHWAVQGPPGVPGTNGTNGTNGVDGINGTDGTNGIDGTNATHADPPCFDNTNRYVDCGNGTVTDTVTGLTWLQDVACLGVADWAGANGAAAGLTNGQCSLTDKSSPGDWRLPTRDEWDVTIARAVALGCTGGTIPSLTNQRGTACLGQNGPPLFSVQALLDLRVFWSSTANEIVPFEAWFAYFTGVVESNDKTFIFGVWPVRGGQR